MIRLTIPAIDKKEIQAVKEVLKTGYFVQGQKVSKFENAVARYCKARHAIAVSSGTAALHLALMAVDVGSNNEVIIPDFTYPATANVVEQLKAKPVLVDIDLKTFNIDVSKIESKITKRTKAIIPVHLFGQPAQMNMISRIARKHKLFVIEDAACALGAKYNGRFCGTFGDMGCFSFHPRKVITAGEGGMILTNNLKIAQKLRSLRNHGLEVSKQKSDFIYAGLNYRMTDLHAAIGIEQMKKLKRIIRSRARIAAQYSSLLKNISWVGTPDVVSGSSPVFQSYVVLLKGKGTKRDRLISHLRKKGIEATIGTYSVHRLIYYKSKYRLKPSEFKSSYTAYQNSLSLPIYHGLKDKDIRSIIQAIKDF